MAQPTVLPSLASESAVDIDITSQHSRIWLVDDENHGLRLDEAQGQEDLARVPSPDRSTSPQVYRLYKRRFAGLLGLVGLTFSTGMTLPWFGPIATNVSEEFGISLDRVSWLGNIMSVVALPAIPLVPDLARRYGIRRCCEAGSLCLLLSAWIRYAGTAESLDTNKAYALLLLGQLFAAIAHSIFIVLGPKYSETWFDIRSRTTVTMIIAMTNPVGGAVGSVVSPLVEDTRRSILLLGIITTVSVPFVLLVGTAPPTPPSYAGSKKSPPLSSLLRAIVGKDKDPQTSLTPRQRIDFWVLTLSTSMCMAGVNAWSVLGGQILTPHGYSATTAGLLGATLLVSGIIGSIISAPLMDRVFTHHLALTLKISIPIMSCLWLSLVWIVKANNTAALFITISFLGVIGLPTLPIQLELGCDITRNAEASAAVLWFGGNLFSIVLILLEGVLRANEDADPAYNMRRGLILAGSLMMGFGMSVLFLRGKQTRKELDRRKSLQQQVELASAGASPNVERIS